MNYTYQDTHDDTLDENPTPEQFFDDICSYVERMHGIELGNFQLGNEWYVEASSYGGNELYFYDSKEDAENKEEPYYRFSDNERSNYDFENPNYDGDLSVVEMLYQYGKNHNFDIEDTLLNFATDMLSESVNYR